MNAKIFQYFEMEKVWDKFHGVYAFFSKISINIFLLILVLENIYFFFFRRKCKIVFTTKSH